MNFRQPEVGGAVTGGSDVTDSGVSGIPLVAVLLVLAVVLVCVGVGAGYLVVRRRRKYSPPPSPASTITILKNGNSKVMSTHYFSSNPSEI